MTERLKAERPSSLLVEQDVDMAMRVADKAPTA
jgi:hypothetical protein